MCKFVQRKVQGFTLVELLVVISIIALLLAILLPSLQSAKIQAESLVDKTQLKDIGIAFGLYMNDWNGDLPPTIRTKEEKNSSKSEAKSRWFIRVAKYYKKDQAGMYDWNLLKCPVTQKLLARNGAAWSKLLGTEVGPFGAGGIYLYNMWFCGTDDRNPDRQYWKKASMCKQTSGVPLLSCCNPEDPFGGRPGSSGWEMGVPGPHPNAIKYGYARNFSATAIRLMVNKEGVAPNHKDKCNFLFLDFHAEGRSVVKLGQWPWIGNNANEQVKGESVFKPKR